MLTRALNLVSQSRAYSRIAIAMARGSATSNLRTIDENDPESWEFSGFSQNGEDGIIDHLIRHLRRPTRRFLEIGSSSGIENLTAWLALARRYSGVMVEGNPRLARIAGLIYPSMNQGVEFRCQMVSTANVLELLSLLPDLEPDFFSLDIDGNDFYVARVLLTNGFRPSVVAVEYNSAFGPSRSLTIPYKEDFNTYSAHASGLYFGASVTCWRKLFEQHGYEFVTVDTNGVNAFFIRRSQFSQALPARFKQTEFRDNFAHIRKFGGDWAAHFDVIGSLPLVENP